MENYELKIAVSIVILFCISTAIYYASTHQELNLYKQLSDKELVELWEETSIVTEVHINAYKELDKRGYFDKENKKSEIEANKKLNELLNNQFFQRVTENKNNNMSNSLIWKILKARLKLWLKKQVKRVWKFLNKKHYVGKYPRVKKWLTIVAWIVVDCYIVFTALDYNVKEVYIVERVGAVVETKETETASLDTINGKVEQQASIEVAPLTVEDKIKARFKENGKMMLAIAKAENINLDLKAVGYNCMYGDKSMACNAEDRDNAWSVDCGLFQINHRGKVCPAELFDLEENLNATEKKLETQGLTAWSSYKANKHLKFLET